MEIDVDAEIIKGLENIIDRIKTKKISVENISLSNGEPLLLRSDGTAEYEQVLTMVFIDQVRYRRCTNERLK